MSYSNFYLRLFAQLPAWWGLSAGLNTFINKNVSGHPILDAILNSFVYTDIINYQQIQYDQLQTRINEYDASGTVITDPHPVIPPVYGATDINLDLISNDYFGDELPRQENETDNSFRTRILINLLQEKATRPGMQSALFKLTGIEPIIYEPSNVSDNGAYNVPSTLAYNTLGSYGGGSWLAYQAWIWVFCPPYQGMANFNGFNSNYGGYNTVTLPSVTPVVLNIYGDAYLIYTPITDAMVINLVRLTKVYGTLIHLYIIRGDSYVHYDV